MSRSTKPTAPREQKPRAESRDAELYRKISVRMHGDEKFRRLTPPPPCGQALWYFLLTGPFVNRIPGVVVGGEMAMAEKLRWPLEGFREAFREVFREGLAKADWDAGLVWLPNGIKHNEPASPNVVTGWRQWWQFVPESPLRAEILQGLGEHLKGMGEGFREAFAKAFPEAFAKAFPKPEAVAVAVPEAVAVAVQTAPPNVGYPTGIGLVDEAWRGVGFTKDLALSGKPYAYATGQLSAGVRAAHLARALRAAKWFSDHGATHSLLTIWENLVDKTPDGGTFRWDGEDAPAELDGEDDGNAEAADPLAHTPYTLAKPKRPKAGEPA